MNRIISSSAKVRSSIRCLLPPALCALISLSLLGQGTGTPTAVLPGHVVKYIENATLLPHTNEMDEEPIQLTIVLTLADPAGAKVLEQEMADPNSLNFGRTISVAEFASRFGPTQEAYDTVLGYLEQNGFRLVLSSISRQTLTVRGTRGQAQKAFNVAIDGYQLNGRTVHAIAGDPAVPEKIAPLILSVFGLSNLAADQPGYAHIPTPLNPTSAATAYDGSLTPAGVANTGGLPPGLDGSGEVIGLIELDGFDFSDVKHWLKFAKLSAKLIDHLTVHPVDGGTTPSGCQLGDANCGTTEVLLDIEAAMGIAQGADIIVFEAQSGTAPATLIRAAGDYLASLTEHSVLSTSWGHCEASGSKSDASAIDSLLASLAMSGVSTFVFTGDTGGTCVDGSGAHPKGGMFPADAPHAVAVGGTDLFVNSHNSYANEQWWYDSGGYGVSKYLPEPSYQAKADPHAGGRSVPDVAMYANPGIVVCQATPTVSPNCGPPLTPSIGGTSLATPLWGATWTLANQAADDAGFDLGTAGNGFLYGHESAFHVATSMKGAGNDFTHVGLGSPDIAKLIGTFIPIKIDNYIPVEGPAAGGTKVKIVGTGFIGVTEVTFGGVAGTNLSVVSDTELSVDSPQAPTDAATIKVVTKAREAAAPEAFDYTPEIDSVIPNSGPLEGGQAVTVTGKGLDTGEQFLFVGEPATHVVCPTPTKCTMLTPANTPGGGPVIAHTHWDGSSAVTSKTHYYFDPISITSFTPLIGPTAGGEMVQVYGHSFGNGKTTFSFGGADATGVKCPDPDYCYMNSPVNSSTGPVQLTASVGNNISTPAKDSFTFEVFPTITKINPDPAKAGTTVKITGTAFNTTAGQTTFDFFGIKVAGTCTSTTQCTAVVPDSPLHSTAVTVTANGYTSLDWVDFYYPGKPPPPGCKPGNCN